MERITVADASFPHMENPIVHMPVTGVLVLDRSTAPDGWSFEMFREHVISRLHRIPVFRRRPLSPPFGIDHPVWVDDLASGIEVLRVAAARSAEESTR
jgi:diacylglycerol O-acyltransferase